MPEDNPDDDDRIFGMDIKHEWNPIGKASIYTDLIGYLL